MNRFPCSDSISHTNDSDCYNDPHPKNLGIGAAGDASVQSKRLRQRKGLAIAYLNINSIRNKFELLEPIILDSVDILVIVETKLDSNFATNQFIIDGFSPPYRYDRNGNGGGLLIYVREGKKLTDYEAPDDIECGILEINMHKKK